MDMPLYRKVEEVVKNLTTLEEQQNIKLDEIQKQLNGLKQLVELIPKVAPKEVTDIPKVSKSKVKGH